MKAFVVALALSAAACTNYHFPHVEGVTGRDVVDGKMELGRLSLKPSVCAGIDTRPDFQALENDSLLTFLKDHGVQARIAEKVRSDYYFVEVQPNPGKDVWVRLGVVIYQSAPEAGEKLEQAIVAKGAGEWGFHRSNIGVLAPKGELEDVLAFVTKTKLACWGVVTVAGGDGATAVPGGYREF